MKNTSSTLIKNKKYLSSLLILSCLFFLFHETATAKYNKDIASISPVFTVKRNPYGEAKEYFIKRKRPLHHFLDMGIGATLIESFYPFEMTAYPFFVYLSYRREKWGQVKIPVIFSFQYEALFNKNTTHRVHALTGLRYPTSHDLSLFHVDFMTGFSLPLSPSFKEDSLALELRLLFTHIIGPKASTHRLYLQWGVKAQLKNQFRSGLIIQVGLDNHL